MLLQGSKEHNNSEIAVRAAAINLTMTDIGHKAGIPRHTAARFGRADHGGQRRIADRLWAALIEEEHRIAAHLRSVCGGEVPRSPTEHSEVEPAPPAQVAQLAEQGE